MNVHRGAARCLALALAVAGSPAAAQPPAASPMSQAERRLFVDDHLNGLHPPMTLNYDVVKTGSLEPGHRDELRLALHAGPDGRCCSAAARFVRDPNRWSLPLIERATANPVVLYFLEHDVREMHRLTGGQPNYFRKRIRLALADTTSVKDTTVEHRGSRLPALEIRVAPYANDPMRARYERFAGKQYVFVLADVPGGVVRLHTVLPSSDGSPLIDESVTLTNAQAGNPPAATPPTAR